MSFTDFEQPVQTTVTNKLSDCFDGTYFVKGNRSVRLTCDDGTAHLYVFLIPDTPPGGTDRIGGDRYSIDVTLENVERAAKAILWHLLH